MTFRPDAVGGLPSGGRPGVLDYRLARNAVLKEYGRGRLSRLDVCDAHPELLRNAIHCGVLTGDPCPVCEASETLVHVTYVFGGRMPAGGRCMLSENELSKLDRGRAELAAYVVEVCRDCHWNHLVRSFPVGQGARPGRTRP